MAAATAWLLLLTGCVERSGVKFFAEGQPQTLSEWNLLTRDGERLGLNDGVVPFDLTTPLFTDYAHKLRTLWMPKGVAAQYRPEASFEFPVGTIISKTFYYPLPEGGAWDGKSVARTAPAQSLLMDETLDLSKVRLLETRLLVRRKEGWVAIPYVWNEQQTDAVLTRAGAIIPLELVTADGERETASYQVPDQNQCAGCHTTNNKSRQIAPIGPKARYLNREFDYAQGRQNQLQRLAQQGYLTGVPQPGQVPAEANAADARADLDARARAYLDINCGHCHSPTGAAITSGLHLNRQAKEPLVLGVCKQPIAAGKGTGNRRYDIVPGKPDESILSFRMDSDDPAVMMPELGRSVVDREGVALIRQWIASQHGSCDG